MSLRGMRSGSVVECLTGDQEVLGSSLTTYIVLSLSKMIYSHNLEPVPPRKMARHGCKIVSWDKKTTTNKHLLCSSLRIRGQFHQRVYDVFLS